MKTTDVSEYGDQSCSCTSCLYRSESDRPSLRRIISQGSRIDRLYYGKYIPLRERKLLEKLVRTRGVYNDIKAQLLSSSSLSNDTKSVFKPKRKLSLKKVYDPHHSEAILKLVDLVDKGEKMESNELNGCCSCCSCSSKFNLHYKSTDRQRKKRAYPGAYRHIHSRQITGKNTKRGVRFKTKHIKSDPCTCTFKFSGMLKNISKAKSKKNRRQFPVTLGDFMPTTDEEINQKSKKILPFEKLQQSKTKVKNILTESTKKLSNSKIKIQETIDLHIKKSIDKLNKVQNNIQSKLDVKKKLPEFKKSITTICDCPVNKITSQIKKDSISKFKDVLKRKRMMKDWECDSECIEDICIPEECYYKLKQIGSHSLKPKSDRYNKDRLIGGPLINPSIKSTSKQLNTFEPTTDKQKPLLREENNQVKKSFSFNLASNKKQNKSNTLQKDNKNVKKKKTKFLCKCKNKSKQKSQNLQSSALQPVIAVTKSKTKHLNISYPREKGINFNPKPKFKNINPESHQQVVRLGSSFTFNIEFYKNKGESLKSVSPINSQRLSNNLRQLRDKNKMKKTKLTVKRHHQGSQIRFQYPMKNTKTGRDNFKPCFCPIKLNSKRNRLNSDTMINKGIATLEKSIMTFNSLSDSCTPLDCAISTKCNLIECKRNNLINNINTSAYYAYPSVVNIKKKQQNKLQAPQILLPYECEPGVCIPDTCDPYQCLKLINTRKAKMKHRLVQCDCHSKISLFTKNKSSSEYKPQYKSLKPKIVKPMFFHKNKKKQNKVKKVKNITKEKYIINDTSANENSQQVVRIGSTLSFNLEFYKTKSPYSLIPERLSKKNYPIAYQKNANQKFVKIAPLNKYAAKKPGFGTTLKRCFCTLKLQEKTNKNTKKNKNLTTAADFQNVVSNVVITSNKSTKTMNNVNLKAFECEPFICVPGECDPYECLERINKRYRHSKEIGSITEYPKRKSVSSTTYSKKSLKSITIQSKPYSKDRKSLTKPKTIVSKLKRYTSTQNHPGKSKEAVKIGSSFSFNIEIVKSKTPVKEINSKPDVAHKTQRKKFPKKEKQKTNFNRLNVANVNAQIKGDSKLSKSSMAGHLVKRCFCTLNLQKHHKLPSTYNKEYMINHAIAKINPFLPGKNSHNPLQKDIDCIDNNNLEKDKFSISKYRSNKNATSNKVEKLSQFYLQNIDADVLKPSTSFIENRLTYLKESAITNRHQYFRSCFCTMNLQVMDKNISSKKQKNSAPVIIDKSQKDLFKTDNRKCEKSSVRLGSTFSFDIEFSKRHIDDLLVTKYAPDTTLVNQEKYKTNKLKSIGRKRNNITYRNRLSQSGIDKFSHKSSNSAPVKKCFCTLKLQKRGRWHVKNSNKRLNSTITINPSINRLTVDRAQNTMLKPLKIAQSLRPYECEPNICNPGYCDPYQCLEIMKRKTLYKHTKESGVDTLQSKKSASSLTIRSISKGTQKRHFVKPKRNDRNLSKKTFQSDDLKPSRQVVRVGSNLSFNIEFFKDKISPEGAQIKIKDFKEKKEVKNADNLTRKKDHITSQKYVQSKDTEIKKVPKIVSTIAGFKNESTLINKCLCFFKSIKPFTLMKHEGIHINKISRYDKNTTTPNIMIAEEYQQYPYECEPGICIPGKCNPYNCYEILKRSRNKTNSIASATSERNNLRSISTNSIKLVSKNAKAQFRNKEVYKNIKNEQLSVQNSDLKVVKIGSNFTFNIEFYKNKFPKHDMNSYLPLQKLHLNSRANNRKEMVKNQIKHNELSTRSQTSQIDRIQKINRSTEDKRFLKRCFCQLGLQNQNSNILNVQLKEKEKNEDIKLRTKSVMTKKEKKHLDILKRFECDPDICVPYQCNPYECEKIMNIRKKQGYRAIGTGGKTTRNLSVSSETKSTKKSKHRTQTVKRRGMYESKYKEKYPSHKVKIGSSFEFNIEFSKNKNNTGLEINKQPKLTNKISKRPSPEGHSNSFKNKKQVKFTSNGTKAIKSQSKLTNTTKPFLNRCFCTLFLKKHRKQKELSVKKITSNIGTATQWPLRQLDILPYECEPQICIPGECNPVECLERIMKRTKNFGGTVNTLLKQNTASTMTAAKARTKAKRNQFQSLNDHNLLQKKETPRNLTKQAVRIGSNFNFNIEFYKNIAVPPTSTKKPKKQTTLKGEYRKDVQTNQQDKLPLKTKSTFSKPDNSILKRCFCTLKLQKEACNISNCPELKVQRIQTKEQRITHRIMNERKTRAGFFKKCLCVFKIRKINRKKFTTPVLNSENKFHIAPGREHQKSVDTLEELLPFECEPNVCLPGKCDPYECEKRIRKRLLHREMDKITITDVVKSKSIMSQVPRTKQKHKTNLYSDKKQNQQLKIEGHTYSKTMIPKQFHKDRSRKLVTSKLTSDSNKQAVRVGSNINFNIEFSKQLKPALNPKFTKENLPTKHVLENVQNKNITTKSALIRNSGSQGNVIRTKDKTLEVQNIRNRCFCTLKLQKKSHPRYLGNNLNPMSIPQPYPQVFEVRRVAVTHKSKISSKKTVSNLRTVGTRINKKHLKENKSIVSQCNICPCKEEIISSPVMNTIFPYTPTKFKKATSKTMFTVPNTFLNKNKINRIYKTSYRKKLNRKKSRRNINYNKMHSINEKELHEKYYSLKRFLCRCGALLKNTQQTTKYSTIDTINYRKLNSNNYNNIQVNRPKRICNHHYEQIRNCKSDRSPTNNFKKMNIETSNSLKLDNICGDKCIFYSQNTTGYKGKRPILSLRLDQKKYRQNHKNKENNKFDHPSSALISGKPKSGDEICCTTLQPSIKGKGWNDEATCIHCQNKVKERSEKKRSLPPLKVHFVDNESNDKTLDKPTKQKKSLKSKITNDIMGHKAINYVNCYSCGRKLNKVELQKAAGDRSVSVSEHNKNNSKKYHNYKIKDIFKINKNIENECSGQYKERPLFEMQLNSDDFGIINKEHVMDNVTKFRNKNIKEFDKFHKKHKKTCRCCLCLFKENKTGAQLHITPKGSKLSRTLEKLLLCSNAKTTDFNKTCVCGSYDCSKKNLKVNTGLGKNINTYWRPCFCGSPICARESAAMKAISISPDEVNCICKKEHENAMKKIRIAKAKKAAKERAIFLKNQNKEDRIRRKKRQKQDKQSAKSINKNASDLVLAAESAIDIGKLGITACTTVLRSVARFASDPKHAYNTLQAMKNDPKLMARHLKNVFDDSGAAATAKRVRLRCLAMKGIKKVKSTLEKYAITNFLLHIADKDPKRRLPKKIKPKRVRERLDFGCSLYMASLRKRPYLSVYNRCPWFYPHFLSLVNVWKQFADITLFLLAVVVWSPCILCMEVCRAMMCCFFCTG